uniref:Uncharacterized protein n=1 Tax=Amphora coffeiformis TaxID=265554 RepID=A0A7S3L0A2_9STRA
MMPRVFSLLLLCASTVLGAHLRRAATSTAVVCPTQRPTSGESCRAVQHCEYDFIQTPDSNKDFECTGSLTCLPMTTCFCSGDNVWECRDISGDSLSGCSNFPEGSFESCSPPKKNHDSKPQVQQQQQQQAILLRDVAAEQKERLSTACPLVAPVSGSSCSIQAAAAQEAASFCAYEFTSLPVYLQDGYCSETEVTCVPLKTCECNDNTNVWECTAMTVARCRGPTPEGAFQACPPNLS